MSRPMPTHADATHDPVTREYRMDTQLHLYRRADLAVPDHAHVIPLCQESEIYPARHPRDMVGVPRLPGQRLDRCASCDVADRQRRAADRRAAERAEQGATR
jgi:hypothetical protein